MQEESLKTEDGSLAAHTGMPDSDAEERRKSRLSQRLSQYGQVVAWATVVIGLLVLLGWQVDISVLKRVLPGQSSMKPNTAVGLILAGVSLHLLILAPENLAVTAGRKLLALLLAAVVAAIGLFTSAEYLIGINLRIDDLLFPSSWVAGREAARMSLATALSFVFLGLALLSLEARKKFFHVLSEASALAVLLVGLVALLGYVYEIEAFYYRVPFSSMSLHSRFLLPALGLAVLFARPQRGLASVIISPHGGGVIARRVLPAAIFVLIVLGSLRVEGEEAGLYGTKTGTALLITTCLTIMVVSLWLGAHSLNKSDARSVQALAALHESEGEFRTMANSIPQLAWMAHADGSIYWYNSRWHEYTGTTHAQMEGWGWQSVHDPAVLPEVMERWQAAIATGQPFEMEFPLRGADGTFRAFLTRIHPFKDSHGKVLRWFGTNTDVDELKRIESSLVETRARLNSTLAAGAVGTWSWDIPNDRLTADEFTARVFSITPDAAAQGLPAAAYLAAIDEEDRAGVEASLARAIAACGEYDIEYRLRSENGEPRWLQARGRVAGDADGNALRFDGAVMDITARKHDEAAVIEAGRFAQTTLDALSGHLCVLDENGAILATNRAWRRFGEMNPAPTRPAQASENYLQVCDAVEGAEATDAVAFAAGIRAVLKGELPEFAMEYACHSPREQRWFVGRVTRFPGEQPVRVVVAHENISARKQAEAAVRASEEQQRLAVEATNLGTWDLKTVTGERQWSLQSKKIFGLPAEAPLTSEAIRRIIHPDDRELMDEALQRALEPDGAGELSVEYRILPDNAGQRWIESKGRAIFEGGRPVRWIGTMLDITERKQVEETLRSKNEELASMTQQLWQTSKLATMGELAASIAHELNNPLATVALRTESLLMQLPPDAGQRKPLEIIGQEVDRMANLVSNLLQFSRRSHRQVSTVNPSEEIVNSVELVHYHLRSRNVAVVRDFPTSLPMIQADRQQLRQLFLNLLTNASDAMPDGGEVTVRATLGAGLGPPTVIIEVADNGEGISAENLEKIWSPFFTTKPEGKGTGLGLAICRRIVEEHGGTMDISSTPGQGTIVTVVLPAPEEILEVAAWTGNSGVEVGK